MGYSKCSSKRQVYYSNTLPQETRKITNIQPNLIHKATRERRTNKTQSFRRKDVIKFRIVVNERDLKK